MTASSSYIGTVDNFWSRDDVRVHTVGVRPRQLKSSLRDLFEGKPTRTAGAKRRGAEAARQPVSAGMSSRRKTALAAWCDGADQDAKTRMAWNATSAWSLTPSCANYAAVNTRNAAAAISPTAAAGGRPRDPSHAGGRGLGVGKGHDMSARSREPWSTGPTGPGGRTLPLYRGTVTAGHHPHPPT